METPALTAAKKEAALKLRVSGPIMKTFLVLLEAYLTGGPVEDSSLYVNKDDIDDHVRSRIASLRVALKGTIFRFPDGRSREFEIPHGKPYRLQDAQAISLSLVWASHMHHREDVLIQTFERLFFRYKSTYIRDLRVNHVEDTKRIADLLKRPMEEFSPSMHYVSSGELRAAITLQNFFVANGKKAQLNSGPDFSEDSRHNLILLGAARVEARQLDAPQYEVFKVFDGGVQPRFRDRTERDGRHRTVHVLMSRRHSSQRSSEYTVIESSHGRAIHGVCAQLVDADTSLCADVVARLGKNSGLLPELFQVVFRVSLVPSGHYVSHANQIEIVECKSYQPKSVAFKAGGKP
jgi:hypothetical protein